MRRLVAALALSVATLLTACGPGPVCAAIPTCEAGQSSSSTACGATETCSKVTVCDSTIYCRPSTDGGTP